MINRFGSTRLGVWFVSHLVSPLQRWLYQRTAGKVLLTGGNHSQILLLTTIGRRTGKERTTPVFFLPDGDQIVICNVNPGFERTNPWVLNLRANPLVTVQIGAEIYSCQAKEGSEKEIDQYWPRLLKIWPAYQVHFANSRQRAMFILKRIGQPLPHQP